MRITYSQFSSVLLLFILVGRGHRKSGTNWEVWTHGSMIHYFWVHTVNAGARFFFLDPYFPISDQRELIGYHGSTFFFPISYAKLWKDWIHGFQWVPAGTHWTPWIHVKCIKLKNGSMISNECLLELIGNHGSTPKDIFFKERFFYQLKIHWW